MDFLIFHGNMRMISNEWYYDIMVNMHTSWRKKYIDNQTLLSLKVAYIYTKPKETGIPLKFNWL